MEKLAQIWEKDLQILGIVNINQKPQENSVDFINFIDKEINSKLWFLSGDSYNQVYKSFNLF